MGDRTKLDSGHELDDPCHINGVSIRASGKGQEQHGFTPGRIQDIDVGDDDGTLRVGSIGTKGESGDFILQPAHRFAQALGCLVEFTDRHRGLVGRLRSGGTLLRGSDRLLATGRACPRLPDRTAGAGPEHR